MIRRYLTTGAATLFVACGPKTSGTLNPHEAARWLHEACAITFASDPVVLDSAWSVSKTPQGRVVSVRAVVVLPEAQIAPTLAALRRNRLLHRRGELESRSSYESYPEAPRQRECELDRSLHKLYFSFTG